MTPRLVAALTHLMIPWAGSIPVTPTIGADKPTKRCANCNHPHHHNNSFCSARCCREYRQT